MSTLTTEEQTTLVRRMGENIRVAIARTISDGYMHHMIGAHLIHFGLMEALVHTFNMLPTDELKLAHLNTFTRVLNEEVTLMIKPSSGEMQ